MEDTLREMMIPPVDHIRQKYPCCIVWTPIPFLTWLCPVIGHMGIGMSSGVIKDFAGPYFVSTDNMAFGKPTKYWQLDPQKVEGGVEGWDKAVNEASEIYKNKNLLPSVYVCPLMMPLAVVKGKTSEKSSSNQHNLCCDNCHSHVALALNKMEYNNSTRWNMVKLAFLIFVHGKYVSLMGFLKTWVPFIIILIGILILIMFL